VRERIKGMERRRRRKGMGQGQGLGIFKEFILYSL